jgi:hypothetical protein
MEGPHATSKQFARGARDNRRIAKEMPSSEPSPDNAESSAGSAPPRALRLPMKIFQIGFNKCGTRTMHHYLRANGISSVHWDNGRLAQRMFANLANGDDLLTGYETFDAFTDMEFLDSTGLCYLEANKLFPYLAEKYPDAVFILNTRDREDWIRSRLAHGSEPYAERQMTYFNVTSEEELAERWRADWERHHRRVTEFFAGKPYRFFVCRIETDLPHLFNKVLPDLKLDESLYERHNVTEERNRKFYAKGLRRSTQRLQRRAKSMLTRLLPANLRWSR